MSRRFVALPLAVMLASCAASAPTPVAGGPATAVVADLAMPAPLERTAPVISNSELMQGGWLIGRATADVDRIIHGGETIVPASDGSFFIGFDRDAETDASLEVVYTDGSTRVMPLTLAEGKWPLQNVNAPYRGAARSDAEFERVRGGELAQIEAARAKVSDSSGWRQPFIWPVQGRISGRFGAQRIYQGKPGPYHGGLDIAVPTGTPFVAPADGTVILATASPFTLEGYLLMIDHGNGLNSAFLHCAQIRVSAGDRVKQGAVIGTVGATGRATGPHLHWGVKWREARIDPLLLLKRPDLQASN